MPTTTAKQRRRKEVINWSTRSIEVEGVKLSHNIFRDFEKCFSELHYFEGYPFVPWKDLQKKLSAPCRMVCIIEELFQSEVLLVEKESLSKRLIITRGFRIGDLTCNTKSFLRLEHIYKSERMFNVFKRLKRDGLDILNKIIKKNPPVMEYAVHSAPFVTGVLYTTPDARWGPIQGIYVLHCGSTFSF
ncbi:hypothetical protein P3T76_007272 [Phytophthora citrophthora]|uniref:Uncharacterized protein n=1 Tax=Phytophthora citrophthora TaxID=4793 RepID=A0AAD9LMH2_9STRA|nr:hypothetical protein P3T76_007272 [Phytophthora citrophthora]